MDIDTSIKNSEKPLIEATREILKIRSVKEEPLQGKPFGDGPARALNYALDLAKSFGLKTRNLDNYVGWAEWGEGNEMIGIIVHLDVVPEGSGWTYPPMVEKSTTEKFTVVEPLMIKGLQWQLSLL